MARRSPLWEAIVHEFQLSTATKRQASRVAAVYTDLVALHALPDEIPVRRRRLVAMWGVKCDTPEALAKHWSKLVEVRTTIPGVSSKEQAEREAEYAELRRQFGDTKFKTFKLGEPWP